MKKLSLLLLSSTLLLLLTTLKVLGQCTPSYYDASSSCSYGWVIGSFSVTGYASTRINDVSSCSGSGYSDRYSRDSCQFQQGISYTASISSAGGYYYGYNVETYIDFNNNNTFESSESVGGANSISGSSSYSLSIPLTAALGTHRMRVITEFRSYSSSYPGIDPCGSGLTYGEARDYRVRIVAAPPCSGTPSAGRATSTLATSCGTRTFTLSLTSSTVASGLTYQWQSSTDSSTWSNISGATTFPYTTSQSTRTYYRCLVTCGSVTSTSTPVVVNYSRLCYCDPSFSSAGYSCSTYSFTFAEFDLSGDSSTTIRDRASCDNTGYLDRLALSATLMQSRSYTATVTTGAASYYNMSVQYWIDANDNGTFESSETVGGVSRFSTTTTFSITVPFSATPGIHRMRAMIAYASGSSTYPSMDPCASGYSYGEIRDYTIKIIAPPPCSGSPAPGRIVASTALACPSRSFTLTDTGFTLAGSLDMQWQVSSDSVTFSNISGATSNVYSGTITGVRYFRVRLRCATTSDTSYTAVHRMNYIPYCYCIPTFVSSYYLGLACSSYGMNIASFDVAGHSGSTLHDVTPCDGNGYYDFTSMSVNLQQAGSYSTTVTSTSSSYNMTVQTWIDFNDNGTFENSEDVGGIASYRGSGTYSLAIPIAARTGSHRMRTMVVYSSYAAYPAVNPCSTTSYYYGEARDYTVNIIALPPCSGTPTAGSLVANIGSACRADTFTIVDTGFTRAGSLAFSWQQSTDSTTWTTIAGATDYYYSDTQSVSTYYRCIVTCTVSGASDTTYHAYIGFVSACYCRPAITIASSCTSYGMDIASFLVNGHSGSSLADYMHCSTTGYINRTGLSVSMMQGTTYTATTTSTSSSYRLNIQAWIDFNDDGSFSSFESVGGYNNYMSSTTFGVNIPIAATVGLHRMRVRVTYGTGTGLMYPSIDPCSTSYYYGDCRDYMVNIVALPPCSGTPSAGSAYATTGRACPSRSFTVADTNFTRAGSLAFAWERSSDSSTWTGISGATTNYYTGTTTGPTWYRLKVTCTVSGSSAYSVPVRVLWDSACYCIPYFSSAMYACTSYGMDIAQFTIVGESSTSIDDRARCDGSGYMDRTTLSCDVMQSLTYAVTIGASMSTYSLNAQVWIDFNNNGTFESSETVGGVNNYSGSTVFNITIPLTARTGVHRMRVLETYAAYGYVYPSLDPCPTYYYYGEARDYMVNVVPLPPCSGTPNAGDAVSTSNIVCSSTTFTLSPVGYTPAGSLTFQWQSSSDSVTWTNISGATNFSYSGRTTSDMYYRVIFNCSLSGSSDTSTYTFINYISRCYCTPSYSSASYSCTGGYNLLRFTLNGHVSSRIDDRASCDGTGYLNRTGLIADMMQSQRYMFTCYTRTSATAGMNMQVWIDYNDDGVFSSSESVAGVNGYNSGSPAVDTIAVPASAPVGIHAMRVVTNYNYPYSSYYGSSYSASYPSIDPCVPGYLYGETRDYAVRILLLPPCTGTPSAGTAQASVTTACPSTPFTVSVTGHTYASGLAYQWQVSADSVTWSDITGDTMLTASVTQSGPRYYRIKFLCRSSGGTDYSAPVYVNYISYCYCAPYYSMASSACSTYGLGITRFAIAAYGSTFDDRNPCIGVPGYQILTGLSANFLQGATYTATLSSGSSTNGMIAEVWIDYNNDGTFNRTSESIGGVSSFRGTTTFTLSIPRTAALGSHRMRIVTTWDASGYTYPHLDPCASGYVMGEARDYTANIVLPSCLGTPDGGNALASPSVGCVSFSTLLSLDTTASTGAGISYTWQVSTDSTTWSTIGSTTSSTYTASLSTRSFYRAVVYCAISSQADTSSAVAVSVLPAPASITGASYVCGGSSTTLSSTTTGGTWSVTPLTVATISSTGILYGVSTGTAAVTYTGPNGCNTVASVAVNPSPSAITGITSACVGGSTPLSSATAGGRWSSASPSIASVSSTGTVYGVSAGTAVISYTLPTGCSGPSPTTTTTVTINPLPSAITGTTSVCLGAVTTLSSATSGGVWSSGSTSTITVSSSTGRVTGVTVGSGTITYTNPSTGCATTATVSVNSLTYPTLSLASTPGTSVCAGTSVTYVANTTNAGSAPTYVWSVNGTIVAGGTSYTYTPSNGDVVNIWFRSSANCATPDSMSRLTRMSVTPTARPAITTSTGMGDTVCAGTSITLSTSVTDGGSSPTFRWFVNGTPVLAAGSYTYTPSHGDVITTRVISNAACRAYDSATTTKVISVSAPVTPDVTLNAISGVNICSGSYANFTASGLYGGSTPVYTWYVNGTAMATGSAFSYLPSNGDRVSVYMVSSFPCVTDSVDSAFVIISVIPTISPVISISVTPGYIITSGTTVTFSCAIISGGGSAPTFQWTRNGSAIAGATNATYTTSSVINGDIYNCTVTNTDPCSNISTIGTPITMSIGDISTTGVNQVNGGKTELLILPNPNNGSFTIKGSLGVSSDENVNIEITDMLGQVVYRNAVKATKGELNESIKLSGSLANGMYLINVKSKTVSQVFHFVLEQ